MSRPWVDRTREQHPRHATTFPGSPKVPDPPGHTLRKGKLPADTDVLAGKALFITGANTGIGHALARRALAWGAAVHVSCRSTEKASSTVARLKREFPAASVNGWVADMANPASVRRLVVELRDRQVRISTLILNAGVHVPFGYYRTSGGIELHRQVNFLSPACLFRSLAEEGTVTEGAAYISSDAHQRGYLPAVFPLSFWARYAQSKLLATTFFLAARPLFPTLTISVLSPGNVETDVHRYKHRWIRALRSLTGPGRAPDQAALELLDALFRSDDPERYRNRGRPGHVAPHCSDPARMLAVWQEVEATMSPRQRPNALDVLRNHSGNLVRLAPSVHRPKTISDVADIVRSARRRGSTVRVVGSRHSYNDCFYSNAELISLEGFDRMGGIDRTNSTITIGAGVNVQALCDHLDSHGYTLRWAGNSGAQTFVGAALTGTHGYCRDGGLLAELIVGVRAISGTGEVLNITTEEELRAIRVSLGTICTVVEVTIELTRKRSFVEYRLETLDEAEFLAGFCRAARGNNYFRFFPNRFHPERMSVLTINPSAATPTEDALMRVRYIDQSSPPPAAVALVRGLLRSSATQTLLRALPAPRLGMSIVARFSSLMFVNAGIVDRWYGVVGLAYEAWNDDETRNMEVAIRPEDFEAFLDVYRSAERVFRQAGAGRDCYFTGRYVGASDRTLLGPNHARDVVFVDVHATQSPEAADFLRDLEHRLASLMAIRPHWGKEFAADRSALRRAYPAATWEAFDALKRLYDPDNVFSNDYTRRVFGW